METVLSFGVGCLHFAAKYEVAEDFNSIEYTKEIVSFLEEYENISNIEISDYRYSDGDGFGLNRGDDIYIQRSSIIPWPADLKISFDINIPMRTQKELLRGLSEAEECEKFGVVIFYTGYFPVVFIFPHEKHLRNPSSKVIALREYLKNIIQ